MGGHRARAATAAGDDLAGPWHRILAITAPAGAGSPESDFVAVLPAALSAAERGRAFVTGWLSRGGGAPLELITNAGALGGADPGSAPAPGLLFPGGAKGHSQEELNERATQISPARQVKSPPVPFLIIHGDADPLVPLQQSKIMIEKLKENKVPCELIVHKGGSHGWLTIDQDVPKLADWFDKYLPKK